jgi:hypothetical protein
MALPLLSIAPAVEIFRPRALMPRPRRRPLPRAEALAQLDREIAVVAARCLCAVADGWDTRRLGYPSESANPFELEVGALFGLQSGHAAEKVDAARAQLATAEAACAADEEHRSRRSPLGALARELDLPPIAVDVLMVIAAPQLRGDLARLYAILANATARPMCDELLVTQILGAHRRHEIADVLDPAQPLVRFGLVRVVTGKTRPFAALSIDPVVLARLRRAGRPRQLGPSSVRRRGPELDGIWMPAKVREELETALSARPASPTRLVVRGREGSGRRTVLSALARRANRKLVVVDAALLPAAPALVDALRGELEAACLGGYLACVVNLDRVPTDPPGAADQLRELFRSHPAPVAFCLPPEAQPPLDPGYLVFDLPPLAEDERLGFWRAALARAGLRVRDVEQLAARYRIGPGLIERAVAAVEPGAGDATPALERVIRQGLASKLGTIASRVSRLASWSTVVLADEVAASVRELIGRIAHRRQVYEGWGFDEVMTTSRGLTALFQGGPGTGKTMIAGIIARELGLDLYRVDLSRVLSKWVGETERNLAEVFDAAEDGQAIILFDEADALFARRSKGETSGDRFANVVVNYLLQRLDSFSGIAFLTTNFGGAIDPAFRRRLSYNLVFPFPDAAMREKLWRVHLPADLPVAGELDLPRLARRYSMSGGAIRNATLRAAFLAAREGAALRQEHLVEAVELEYRDVGKLAAGGTLE